MLALPNELIIQVVNICLPEATSLHAPDGPSTSSSASTWPEINLPGYSGYGPLRQLDEERRALLLPIFKSQLSYNDSEKHNVDYIKIGECLQALLNLRATCHRINRIVCTVLKGKLVYAIGPFRSKAREKMKRYITYSTLWKPVFGAIVFSVDVLRRGYMWEQNCRATSNAIELYTSGIPFLESAGAYVDTLVIESGQNIQSIPNFAAYLHMEDMFYRAMSLLLLRISSSMKKLKTIMLDIDSPEHVDRLFLDPNTCAAVEAQISRGAYVDYFQKTKEAFERDRSVESTAKNIRPIPQFLHIENIKISYLTRWWSGATTAGDIDSLVKFACVFREKELDVVYSKTTYGELPLEWIGFMQAPALCPYCRVCCEHFLGDRDMILECDRCGK